MERRELAYLLGWRPGQPTNSGNRAMSPGGTVELCAEMAAAATSPGCLFLFDRAWTEAERSRAAAIVSQSDSNRDPERGWLCLPTGGTSGEMRFARHDQDTLGAAVEGFRRHFCVDRVNCIGVLPLHHVSGFMAWVRAALSGGEYLHWSWRDLEAGAFPSIADGDWVISLVPTQLARLIDLHGATDWLRRFRAVFLGGAAAWPELLERALERKVPLCPSYGMTETAAMVAALRPAEFASGKTLAYPIMPHVKIVLDSDGCVGIEGESVCRGFYPSFNDDRLLWTQDLGEQVGRLSLRVLGRRDAVINTGGEKVSPIEVEAAILGTGLVRDAAVVGVPDRDWGERVVAFVAGSLSDETKAVLLAALRNQLAPHKVPKAFESVDPWPRNSQGKLNRARLIELWAARNNARENVTEG